MKIIIFLLVLAIQFFHSNISDSSLTEDVLEAQSEINCLTENVFWEARGESKRGMKAVAQVTINRTKAKPFPSSICGVVWEPKQFSWTVKNQRDNTRNGIEIAYNIAYEAYHKGYADKQLEKSGAIYYHATYVKPNWSSKMAMVATIGTHKFYTTKT